MLMTPQERIDRVNAETQRIFDHLVDVNCKANDGIISPQEYSRLNLIANIQLDILERDLELLYYFCDNALKLQTNAVACEALDWYSDPVGYN